MTSARTRINALRLRCRSRQKVFQDPDFLRFVSRDESDLAAIGMHFEAEAAPDWHTQVNRAGCTTVSRNEQEPSTLPGVRQLADKDRATVRRPCEIAQVQ